MKGKRMVALVLAVLGLLVTYGTHIALIALPDMPLGLTHASLNLVASVFITVSVVLLLMKK